MKSKLKITQSNVYGKHTLKFIQIMKEITMKGLVTY